MDKKRFAYLLEQYRENRASDAEMEELDTFLKSEFKEDIIDLIAEELANSNEQSADLERCRTLVGKVSAIDRGIVQTNEPRGAVRSLKSGFWSLRKGYWAAASILLLLSISFLGKQWMDNNEGVKQAVVVQDVQSPTASHAKITLADGREVEIGGLSVGVFELENGSRLVKLADGSLKYERGDEVGDVVEKLVFNTLVNPKGSQVIALEMADGTQVTLNAGSSITYPINFVGNAPRVVRLEGEAFFNVASVMKSDSEGKQSKQRFEVWSKGVLVNVTGTQFNVNSYGNGPEVYVCLAEGAVEVGYDNRILSVLKPKEQARLIKGNDNAFVVQTVDVNAVLAWKNGWFNLEDKSVKQVLLELSTWYDVQVEFRGPVNEISLFGKIGRDLSLNQTLEALTIMGLDCRLENGKVIVN